MGFYTCLHEFFLCEDKYKMRGDKRQRHLLFNNYINMYFSPLTCFLQLVDSNNTCGFCSSLLISFVFCFVSIYLPMIKLLNFLGIIPYSFYYGSHYSSMGIVLFYLLRLEPFTALHRNLQVLLLQLVPS